MGSELKAQYLITSVPVVSQPPVLKPGEWCDSIDIGSVEYMDDIVQPIFCNSGGIVDKLAATASVYHEVLQRYALEVNFAKGKSEAVVAFRGVGSKAEERRLYHEQEGLVRLCGTAAGKSLTVVRDYKHLGTRVDVAASLHPDLSSKLQAMHSVLKSLKGRLFNNKLVEEKSKAIIARGLLFAKGLHAAGTWPELQAKEATRLHVAVCRVYRAIAGVGKENVATLQLLAEKGFTIPILLVRQARLSLLSRVARRAPCRLVHLLWLAKGGPRSWLKAVQADVTAFALDAKFAGLAGDSAESAWLAAADAPAVFRRACVKTMHAPIVMERAIVESRKLKGDVLRILVFLAMFVRKALRRNRLFPSIHLGPIRLFDRLAVLSMAASASLVFSFLAVELGTAISAAIDAVLGGTC